MGMAECGKIMETFIAPEWVVQGEVRYLPCLSVCSLPLVALFLPDSPALLMCPRYPFAPLALAINCLQLVKSECLTQDPNQSF